MAIQKKHFTSVKEYIESFPPDIQEYLELLRDTILEEVSQATEVISYQIPAVMVEGKRVIYYSAWKKHLSLYPFTEKMGKELPETLEYKTSGKGTIQFPFSKPLPLSLVRKIVQLRLKELEIT